MRLGGKLADVGQPAAVDADPVADDPLPDQSLGQRAERRADLLLPVLEPAGQLLRGQRLHPVGLGLALLLARDRERLGELVGDRLGHRVVDVLLVVDEDRVLGRLLGGLRRDLKLRLAEQPDERLGRLQALRHRLLGGRDRLGGLVGEQPQRPRRGLRLDHHDRHVAVLEHPARDDHVERRVAQLLVGRERDPLVPDQRDPHATDRTGERQAPAGPPAGWTSTRR